MARSPSFVPSPTPSTGWGARRKNGLPSPWDGWFESRFARYVIEGRCQDGPKGARCDPDKNGVPRARGVWQVWKYCKGVGTEAEAKCVLSQMRLGLARCGSWEGAFSALHGPGCGWSGARERVQLMRKLLAKP